MTTSGTSSIIMVLISLAAIVSLFAWWISVQTSHRTRGLIVHLEQNQKSYWHSQRRLSRSFNAVGVIEAYRRSAEKIDSDFDALYRARKRGLRTQISAICLAMALIGLVLIGAHFWGWSW
jgi:PDZ domain-containing secreted protein